MDVAFKSLRTRLLGMAADPEFTPLLLNSQRSPTKTESLRSTLLFDVLDLTAKSKRCRDSALLHFYTSVA
jgi:hypothetical protein